MSAAQTPAAEVIATGRAVLGIELGSTRIKACLIDGDDPSRVLATGSHAWENRYRDGNWTYSLDDVWGGVRAAYADLGAQVQSAYDTVISDLAAIGVSAMMHGYLAFDASGELLVPFRTWRNTSTERAAGVLSELLGTNIPLRWSIAHLYQAVLDEEDHVTDVASFTTLAGYVHEKLTGRRVLGIGDASGMFPIDPVTHDYDAEMIEKFDRLVAERAHGLELRSLLPDVLVAGDDAGVLTDEGAALLDETGALRSGILFCPPEGDAGTGMVATNSVAPRTGNVSAGTSIFAMVVLEHPLRRPHDELDLVTTPSGDLVAMVHCNNGASELAAWVSLFERFAEIAGGTLSSDEVFEALFREAFDGAPDAGGILAYNHLAGEPIAGLPEGRPLVLRTPDSRLTLANFMRAQLYGVFATLALGMRVLAEEGVELDRMYAHGGVFRTSGVAQRFLAGALNAPVAVASTASEGGAWGIAVLAAFAADTTAPDLHTYLDDRIFARTGVDVVEPDAEDVPGFAAYLTRYRAGLAVEHAAIAVTP
ncbi:xylulokinase [Microbacterium trichothecenolyticum]|uniref:Sugar (Pentulose or hexulose) kinase n=1 Tax=Microbacterium trichothecenolyticum TaxID=69370 RepID=A0ABU0TV83_MICTR|nr:FGGY-family carbohydrate kinase [Microbacterium trichothecenolyticum]MDQ1123561.1 sugar (pentulose or hexulose) kinase [Microbacterium trichothecenolyticum]